MIRLIQRRLIIPQGDTGTFSIPLQGTLEGNDCALISIYDNLTHQTVLQRRMEVNQEGTMLSYNFASEDTSTLEPDDRGSRYSWDVTILRNPEFDSDDELIHADEVDSYYAAFSLPPCVIKRVTYNVPKQSTTNT